jgi:hypothetical protein
VELVKQGQSLRRHPAVRGILGRFRSRGVTASDVLIASYPRSGSTWLRFMVMRLMEEEPDFDNIRSLLPPLGQQRSPHALRLPDGGRLLRTHEPRIHLGRLAARRVIHLVRDGRHVAVSSYFYQQRKQCSERNLEEFLYRFLRGHVGVYGAWHTHVIGWAATALAHDVLLVRYEDLLREGPKELGRVARFLGLAQGRSVLEQAFEDNRPHQMRVKEARSKRFGGSVASSPLVREGTAGGWHERLTDELQGQFACVAGEALRLCGYLGSIDSHEKPHRCRTRCSVHSDGLGRTDDQP